MTLDEVRDALAEMDGWKYVPAQVDGLGANAHYWWRWTISSAHGGRTYANTHPHAPTLDGADAAMPEGYYWTFNGEGWFAWKFNATKHTATVACTGHIAEHKIADLYALALACRRATEERK